MNTAIITIAALTCLIAFIMLILKILEMLLAARDKQEKS